MSARAADTPPPARLAVPSGVRGGVKTWRRLASARGAAVLQIRVRHPPAAGQAEVPHIRPRVPNNAISVNSVARTQNLVLMGPLLVRNTSPQATCGPLLTATEFPVTDVLCSESSCSAFGRTPRTRGRGSDDDYATRHYHENGRRDEGKPRWDRIKTFRPDVRLVAIGRRSTP